MRLNHVTLSVSDLAYSVDFYTRLGLHQIVADPPSYARFEFPEGDSTLSLSTHGAQPGGTSLHFECETLDERVAELKEQGFEFDQDPTDQPYLWREAILHDPDGNVLFLYHAGKNRLNPPWRLPRSNEDVVRHVFALLRRRDWEGLRELVDPGLEWHLHGPEGGERVLRGASGPRQLTQTWDSQFEDFNVELRDARELGPDRVLYRVEVHGRGRASGVESGQSVTSIARFRDGRVVRVDAFANRDDALREAGLEPDTAG